MRERSEPDQRRGHKFFRKLDLTYLEDDEREEDELRPDGLVLEQEVEVPEDGRAQKGGELQRTREGRVQIKTTRSIPA
jgi:hypothetical protein